MMKGLPRHRLGFYSFVGGLVAAIIVLSLVSG